jgi:hypothetical protein
VLGSPPSAPWPPQNAPAALHTTPPLAPVLALVDGPAPVLVALPVCPVEPVACELDGPVGPCVLVVVPAPCPVLVGDPGDSPPAPSLPSVLAQPAAPRAATADAVTMTAAKHLRACTRPGYARRAATARGMRAGRAGTLLAWRRLMLDAFAHAFDGDGTLCDEREALPMGAVRARGLALGELLAAAGVDPSERVALRPANSAASAAALLFFVSEGRPVALLPPRADAPASCRAELVPDADAPLGVRLVVAPRPPVAGARGVALSTSGSLGRPKVALHEHAALAANAAACVTRLGLTRADRVAIPVPIFHMFGLGAALVPALLAGASIDVQERSNVVRFVARERAFDPTCAFMTPTFARLALAARHGARAYRVTVVAGDRMPRAALEAYEARYGVVAPLYGSTELGAIAACSPDDDLDARAATVGAPLDGVTVALEPIDDDVLGAGAREIRVRHANGFAGYLDALGDVTPRALEGDLWRTKDLGELTKEGRLRVLGRADHAVKRDGVLVMLADLEAELAALTGGAACVVLGGDTTRGAELVACVAPADGGAALDAPSVRAAAQGALPSYAVPDRVVALDALPITSTGKIDRAALRRRHGGTEGP